MAVREELRKPGGTARALAQFVLSGFIAVALLGIVAVEIMRRQGTNEAIRDAKQVTQLAGNGIAAPDLTPGLLRGNPADIHRMDELVHRSIVRGPVVRVKIWDHSGKVVYSDEHRLIGQRRVSPHTVASYRDTFRLLLKFAQRRLKKEPSRLGWLDTHLRHALEPVAYHQPGKFSERIRLESQYLWLVDLVNHRAGWPR